jgi:hypothetical protein
LFLPIYPKIALVGGAFGVTVSAAMKTLSAKAKIKLFLQLDGHKKNMMRFMQQKES